MAEATDTAIEIGDVIQLDPRKCTWGPLLAIVDRVHGWGVRCVCLVPFPVNSPGHFMQRVPHGDYVRIGKAQWKDPSDG